MMKKILTASSKTKLSNFFSTIKENSKETQNTLTLYMNYLVVTYAFVLPITWKGRSTIFLFILFLFLARRNFIYYLKDSFKNPIVQSFLLYLFIHFLWLFGTDNFTQAIKMIDYAQYAVIPLIFLSFVTKEFSYKIIASFAAGVFLSEIISYLVRFQVLPQKLDLFSKNLYTILDIHDPTPFLYHSQYAITLSVVIALFILKLLNKNNSLQIKIISFIFIATATINLSLIGGRSGYLSYIFLAITVIILKFKSKALVPLIFTLLIILTISYTAYNNSPMFKSRIDYSIETINKLNHNIYDFNSSLGTRIAFWYYGLMVVEENLLLGVGTGDQLDEVKTLVPSTDTYITQHPHLHSVYLSQLVQFGIIGLLVYLNIFFQIFKYNYRDENAKEIAIIISVGIMIATLTETFYTKYYLAVFGTMLSAVLATKTMSFTYQNTNIKKELSAYFVIFITTSLLIFIQ